VQPQREASAASKHASIVCFFGDDHY
jgi:hypothetical protein